MHWNDNILKAMQRCLQMEDPAESIKELLCCLGEELGAYRTALYEQDDSGLMKYTYEWDQSGDFDTAGVLSIPIVIDEREVGVCRIEGTENLRDEDTDSMMRHLGLIFGLLIRSRNRWRDLQWKSEHDPLTGCGSRLALRHLIETKQSENLDVTMIVCDLNGLKLMNDLQGHVEGDKFLVRVSTVLKECFDEKYIYRIGGDEFVAVILGGDSVEIAERIDEARGLLGDTVSLGMSTGNLSGTSLAELFREADRAMYEEKKRYYAERTARRKGFWDDKTVEPAERKNRMRRKILIVEDNELSREILAELLEDEYEIWTAENGEAGIRVLAEHYGELSLVILDVYMPVCDGFEFLERTQRDALMSGVPVLVATGSNNPEDEARCLRLGASDFVSKPYNPEVVRGRIRSIIKLRESETTLSAVEYDPLTGLYTLPAFYHHMQTSLDAYPDEEFHLVVLDLQNLKVVNSIFGEMRGDAVLQYVADRYRKIIPGSITARRGNKFYSFCGSSLIPPDLNIPALLDQLVQEAPVPKLVVKTGIYKNVEREVPVSILCDRAITTARGIQDRFAVNIAYYDEQLQGRIIADQRMENAFEEAMERGGFVVWYQPKVDTRTEQIVGAEALVRWILEDGREIPPERFISLFERDGLIGRLDEYVFRQVCEYQAKRRREGRPVVPVSINLSRNSIYRPEVVDRYVEIAEGLDVPKELVPIELTESAAMETEEMITRIERFHAAGFELQLDDFGTGYSSMSCLTTIPFTVVKMDRTLISRITDVRGSSLVHHMITMVQEMDMKLVAEGVENREQAQLLQTYGCDMIQGYFFFAPTDGVNFGALLDWSLAE